MQGELSLCKGTRSRNLITCTMLGGKTRTNISFAFVQSHGLCGACPEWGEAERGEATAQRTSHGRAAAGQPLHSPSAAGCSCAGVRAGSGVSLLLWLMWGPPLSPQAIFGAVW